MYGVLELLGKENKRIHPLLFVVGFDAVGQVEWKTLNISVHRNYEHL